MLRTLFHLTPAFALAAVRYAPETLVMADKVVSHRVRMIDGESWVPVRDLATSSGMVIQRTGDQIVLTPTGEANQIGTLSGKLGETVSNGKWRLTVHSFGPVDSYHVTSQTRPIIRSTAG